MTSRPVTSLSDTFLSATPQVRVSARIKRKPTRYEVSVVTRDEVGAYKPYLWEQSVFEKGAMFRCVCGFLPRFVVPIVVNWSFISLFLLFLPAV